MTKRLVEIDDGLLQQAREALGTETIRDTVETALEQAVKSDHRHTRVTDATLQRFAAATGDLGDEEVMNAAWR
jgi:Arc/MetJ family transcription regulator